MAKVLQELLTEVYPVAKKGITKKVITVSIDADLEQKLRRMAKSENRSFSQIVERSIFKTVSDFENQSKSSDDLLLMVQSLVASEAIPSEYRLEMTEFLKEAIRYGQEAERVRKNFQAMESRFDVMLSNILAERSIPYERGLEQTRGSQVPENQ